MLDDGGLALLGYIVAYAVLNASGLLLLRLTLGRSSSAHSRHLGAVLVDPRFFLGLTLYALGFLTWLLSLRTYQLSTIYPVFVGVGYVSVLAASFVVLHEHASLVKVVGMILVGAGLVFVLR